MAKQSRPKLLKNDSIKIASHVAVIPAYGDKPFVGHDTLLRVSSISGTGTRRNPWSISVTDGVYFWHFAPEDIERM